jgi:TP901 family phage tail tape measure protein
VDSIYQLAVMVSLVDKITGPAQKVFGSLKNYEAMIEKGKGWVESGKQMSIAGAMAKGSADQMIDSLRSLTAPTQAVDDAMANLETVTTSTMGSMEKSMAASRKAAIDWSKKHSDSAAKFAQTTYMMASAGLNDVQALEATKTAMTVAKATMADSGETANLVAILYNNMGDKTKNVRMEMTRLGDVLTKTQQYFQFKNLGQLTEGLTYAVPTALQFSQSIEEVNAVIGMLNNAGLQGSQAGTAYAASMRTMIKASKDLGFTLGRNTNGGISLIKTIENIRKKYGDFATMSDKTKMAFQQAFGDEGLRAIALLLGKTNEMNAALKVVSNSAGAAAAAQRQIEMKSPSEQYQILQNNLDAVRDTLASKLLPSVLALIPTVNKLLDSFGRFAEKHPGLVKLAVGAFALGAAILAVVAPILTVTGAMTMMAGHGLTGLGKIAKGILYLQKLVTGGKIVSGVKAVGVAMKLAFSAGSRAILAAAQSVWGFITALLANPITWVVIGVVALAAGAYLLIRNWSAVKAFFINIWTSITGTWNQMPGWLQNLVNGLLIVFMPFIGIPLLIVRNWETIKAFFIGLWNSIVANWSTILAWAKNIGVALLVAFAPFIGIPLLVIANWNKIGPALQSVMKAIGNWFAGLGQQALQWGANLITMFVRGIQQKIAVLKDGVVYVANQIKRFLGFHSPAEAGPGAEADVWAPNLMKMFQKGITAGVPGLRKAATAAALGVSMALAQTGAPALAMGTRPELQPLPVQTVNVQPQVQPLQSLAVNQIPVAVRPELQPLPVQTVNVQQQVQPLQPLAAIQRPLAALPESQPLPVPPAPVPEPPSRPERPAVPPVRIQLPPSAQQPPATKRPVDAPERTGKQRPVIVIKGNVTIAANNPEDLWEQLQQLTAEEGDGDE